MTTAEADANGNGTGTSVDDNDPAAIARENECRYRYVVSRGHDIYCRQARENENFYLGGGLQWDPTVRQELEDEKRPAEEVNEIAGAVNAACGYQIANRMDVTCVPRGGAADGQIAKALNLTFKSELDRLKFRWLESQVFQDGLIEQRGYFELRIAADENMTGQVALAVLDPMDGIPDPDAKSYDPDDWADFIKPKWLTLDEIEQHYGREARQKVEDGDKPPDPDYGDGNDDDGVPRSRFGDDDTGPTYDAKMVDGGVERWRIIDRQRHVYAYAMVAIYTDTADVVPIDDVGAEELAALKKAPNVLLTRRRTRRVRWTVSCGDLLLHDDWSPYRHFDVIPYFPYFRRGRTRGMVDNAISPQRTLNKAISQALHIVNSTANSGWVVEQESLTNMETADLEKRGAETGLVVEYKKGTTKPEKIKANEVPSGIVQLINVSRENIKAVTGVNESMLGVGSDDMSGVAIQSRQFAAQQQLAMPLDNLNRTRFMLASRMLELFQAYYTDEREFRITEMDQFGEPETQSVAVNVAQADGSFLNDFTIGKYDVVITDQPINITFDNSQFEQCMSMREKGIRIPDTVVVRYSNLADKANVIQEMQEQAEPADPLDTAKAGTEQAKAGQLEALTEVARANAEFIRSQTVNQNVTAMYSATRAGAEVAAMPEVAPVADEVLQSAGFEDHNAPPAIPTPGPAEQVAAPPPSENTNPLTPPHPDRGVAAGIEKPEGT